MHCLTVTCPAPNDAAAAPQSEIGQKVAADVPNYSPNGAIAFHFPAEG
jgi:hypothetical protein